MHLCLSWPLETETASMTRWKAPCGATEDIFIHMTSKLHMHFPFERHCERFRQTSGSLCVEWVEPQTVAQELLFPGFTTLKTDMTWPDLITNEFFSHTFHPAHDTSEDQLLYHDTDFWIFFYSLILIDVAELQSKLCLGIFVVLNCFFRTRKCPIEI